MRRNGNAQFIVYGEKDRKTAIVTVRRKHNLASVSVKGDVTGPPQKLEADGFTAPVLITDGPELSAFGAGGAWVIDVGKDDVAIQGSCKGM